MTFVHSFEHTLPFVSMRTAYGNDIDKAENVKMDTEVCVDQEHQYGGWYETYDLDTGGERFHAEGVLEVEFDQDPQGGNQVARLQATTDVELPDYIINALEEKGVIIDCENHTRISITSAWTYSQKRGSTHLSYPSTLPSSTAPTSTAFGTSHYRTPSPSVSTTRTSSSTHLTLVN